MASPNLDARYAELDYDWRPDSYWDPASNPLAILLTNVKGAHRRELIQKHFDEGTLDELPAALKDAELSQEMVGFVSSLGPTFMGGEFLPGYRAGEIEIARVSLRSTTADVISLRARPSEGGVAYRVVDEYDGEFYLTPSESEEPLTLGQLVDLIDTCEREGDTYGLAISTSVGNYEFYSADPYQSFAEMLDDALSFTSVSSDFYTSLGAHYGRLTEEWGEAEKKDLEERGVL